MKSGMKYLAAVAFSGLIAVGCGDSKPKSELDAIQYQDNDWLEWNGSDSYVLEVVPMLDENKEEFLCAYYGNRQNDSLKKSDKIEVQTDKWSILATGDETWQSLPLDPKVLNSLNSFGDGPAVGKFVSYQAGILATSYVASALVNFQGYDATNRKSLDNMRSNASGGSPSAIVGSGIFIAGTLYNIYLSWNGGKAALGEDNPWPIKDAIGDKNQMQTVSSWKEFNNAYKTLREAKPKVVEGSCPSPSHVLRKYKLAQLGAEAPEL